MVLSSTLPEDMSPDDTSPDGISPEGISPEGMSPDVIAETEVRKGDEKERGRVEDEGGEAVDVMMERRETVGGDKMFC